MYDKIANYKFLNDATCRKTTTSENKATVKYSSHTSRVECEGSKVRGHTMIQQQYFPLKACFSSFVGSWNITMEDNKESDINILTQA